MLHFTPPHPPVSYQDPMTPDQVEQVRPRRLAVSGRAVATPSNDQLRVDVTTQSFSQTRTVLVPSFDHNLGISQVAIAYLKQAVEADNPDAATYSALASAYRLAGNTTAAAATEKQRDSALAKPAPTPGRN